MRRAKARVACVRQTEAQFQTAVTDYASARGWLWWHDYDSKRNHAGLPDLIFVRSGRLIFAELKSERGRLRAEQKVWLETLRTVPGVETYIWRPSDWDLIEIALR